jgi:hypothetical protein
LPIFAHLVRTLGGKKMAKPQKIKSKSGKISYRIFVNKTVDGRKIRKSKVFSTRQIAVDAGSDESIGASD